MMGSFRPTYAALMVAIILSMSSQTMAQTRSPVPEVDAIPNVVLVEFNAPIQPAGKRSGLALFDAIASDHDVYAMNPAFPVLHQSGISCDQSEKLSNIYRVYFSKDTHPEVLALAFQSDPNVASAEAEYYYRTSHYSGAQNIPDDPEFAYQSTYMDRLQLKEAWEIVKGEQGDVVIAILDSGTDWRHEDLVENVWTNIDEVPDNGLDDDDNGYVDDVHGYDFGRRLPYTPGVTIDLGSNLHGTAVASVSSGESNNRKGMAGSSWNAIYMPLGADCGGGVCHVAEGILYASANGADIINGSFSSTNYDRTSHLAVQCAMEMGTLFIAAAGNNSTNNDIIPYAPASYSETLSVGGTQKNWDRVVFNYGSTVDVFAPGIDIAVAVPNRQYGTLSGTSFASPLVAGIAALVKTRFPLFSPQQIREQLRYSSDPIENRNPSGFEGLLGQGRVNALTAVLTPVPTAIRMTNVEQSGMVSDASSTLLVEAESYFGEGMNQSALVELVEVPPYVQFGSASQTIDFPTGIGKNSVAFPFRYLGDIPYRVTDQINIRLTHDGGTENLSYRFDSQSGETLPVFRDDNVSIRYSITSEGNLGYLDQWGNSAGVGMKIGQNSTSLLYEAGLIVGTHPDQLSSSVIGYKREYHGGRQPIHFHPKPRTQMKINPPDGNGNITTEVTLMDSRSPHPIGVEILEETQLITNHTGSSGGFIIVQYTITNPLPTLIENLHVGLYADWILSRNWDQDLIRYDPERDVIYQISEKEAALRKGESVGIKIRSDDVETRYGAIPNYGIHPDLSWNEVMWEYLSGDHRVGFPTANQWSQIASVGPIELEPGAQQQVAFALVSGLEDEFFMQVDRAVHYWDQGVSSSTGNLQIINTTNSQLELTLDNADTTFTIASLTSSDYISISDGTEKLVALDSGDPLNDDSVITNLNVVADSNYQVIYYSQGDQMEAVTACCAQRATVSSDVVNLRINHNLTQLPPLGLRFMSDQGFVENIVIDQGTVSPYMILPIGVYSLELIKDGKPWLQSNLDMRNFGGESLLFTFLDGTLPTIAPFQSRSGPSLPIIVFDEISVGIQPSGLPPKFTLHASFPNPAYSTIQIQFDLPYSSQISIEIVDLLGKHVMNISAGKIDAGFGVSIPVNIMGLSSGAYLYRVKAQSDMGITSDTGKFVKIR
ncbi:MAG: S8 family serine peptidase [Bacteroidetes bacterium]|nr:S8 family serine peptidase [Bacteroidota bacterium]